MKKSKLKVFIIVLAVIAAVFVSALAGVIMGSGVDFSVTKPDEYWAKIYIKGTIQGSNTGSARVGYDHYATMEYIDKLIEDEGNKGIFLDVDSGGGTVYHSDEMYQKLLEYKEKTGRPIHAYFNTTAASGAYYISCAADYISANKNCWTGSIGVIISLINYSGLYEKLGLQEILITSGENKGMGSGGSAVNEEHIAIYQSLVDESYEEFVNIVAKGRGLDVNTVKQIADGRVYSAKQAKDLALIDEIKSYEEAEAFMSEVCGCEGYYKPMYEVSGWEILLGKAESVIPKSEAQIIKESMESETNGVLLYMYK